MRCSHLITAFIMPLILNRPCAVIHKQVELLLLHADRRGEAEAPGWADGGGSVPQCTDVFPYIQEHNHQDNGGRNSSVFNPP